MRGNVLIGDFFFKLQRHNRTQCYLKYSPFLLFTLLLIWNVNSPKYNVNTLQSALPFCDNDIVKIWHKFTHTNIINYHIVLTQNTKLMTYWPLWYIIYIKDGLYYRSYKSVNVFYIVIISQYPQLLQSIRFSSVRVTTARLKHYFNKLDLFLQRLNFVVKINFRRYIYIYNLVSAIKLYE